MAGTVQVVIDTNVVVAALRSSAGASFRLIGSLGNGEWENNVSTPLLCEYEEQAMVHGTAMGLSKTDVAVTLDAIARHSNRHNIYYQWPDYAREMDDRLVVDIAMAVRADYIITFNERNFVRARE